MNEQNNAAKRLWTPEFLSMGGSNFLLFLVQYIMIAALPIYIMDSLGGGEMEAGLAMAAFQVGTVVARPMAGRLIDDIDKRKLFRLVAAAVCVLMAAFLTLPGLSGLYGLRFVHGLLFALATRAATTRRSAVCLPRLSNCLVCPSYC